MMLDAPAIPADCFAAQHEARIRAALAELSTMAPPARCVGTCKPRPVRVNGVPHPSIKAAARALGCSPQTVRLGLRGGGWRKVEVDGGE